MDLLGHRNGRQGQLGTGPNKAERAREREAILKQLEAGGAGPGMGWSLMVING